MTEFARNFLLEDLDKKYKELNLNFDILKAEIDKYKQDILPVAFEEIKNSTGILEEQKKQFVNELKEKYNIKLNELVTIKSDLEQLSRSYQEQYNQAEIKTKQILDFEKNTSELNDKITQYYDEVFTADDCYKDKLTNLYKEYAEKSNGIISFNNELFSNEFVKTGKILLKDEYDKLSDIEKEKYKFENNQYVEYQERVSLKEQINTVSKEFLEKYQNFKEQSEQVLKQNQDDNKKLRDDLKNMAEELVSGAANAGLAKSYETARKEHRIEMFVWGTIFLLDIVLISAIVFFIFFNNDVNLLFFDIAQFSLNQNDEVTLDKLIQCFLLSFFITLPLIWLAMLANRNILQNKRLYEEFLHKWAIAFSFGGMIREINESDPTPDKEYVKNLLDIYLEATKLNPSITLDKIQQIDNPFDKVKDVVQDLTNVIEKFHKK